MLLVIDNYDSFTYNLVQYLGELGADPVVRRNDAITAPEVLEGGYAGIVISPGPGTPRDAGVTLEIIRELSGSVPILGVCLGHQAIGEAFGGRVIRAPKPIHGKASEVTHDETGRLRGSAATARRGPLSLAHGGAGNLAARAGDYGANPRWPHHGPAP